MTDVDDIKTALTRLGGLLFARDSAFADEFAANGLLIGSEPGERAVGHEEICALAAALFARPNRLTWEWQTVDVAAEGTVGWVFAEGQLVMSDAASRKPYPIE